MWAIVFILGAVVATFVIWLLNRKFSIKWYEWLMGSVSLLLIIGAVQHAFGALAWDYTTAAWLGALIFGVPALILLTVVWQLVARRANKA